MTRIVGDRGEPAACIREMLAQSVPFRGTHEVEIRVEQGYEIQRPSLLFLRALEKPTEIQVHVGGQVFLVARGELV